MKRLYVSLIILGCICSAGFGQIKSPLLIGKFQSRQTTDHGIQVETGHALIRIECYSPSIVRVRVAKGEFDPDFSYAVIREAESNFTAVKETRDEIRCFTPEMTVSVQKAPFRIRFYTSDNQLLSEDFSDFGVTWIGDEVTCHRTLFPGEKFIGLGEKTGPLNRRGYSYENWNTDHAYGPDTDPLYKSIPFFMGIHDSLTYGIFLDNSYRTRFNFGGSTDELFSSFTACHGELNYYFFAAPSVREIIRDYSWLTGTMPLPPYWSLGYQQCRWGYYPESEVLRIARTFREKQLPCDVIYLDIDYMDHYKIFTWDSLRFPDPRRMTNLLQDLGFHLAVIVDPGIKVEKGYFAYEEGIVNDYFIRYPGGRLYVGNVWPGRCHFPDFTNPLARSWWGKSFVQLTEAGVEGFWNDMNEPAVWGQNIPDILELDFDGQKATMARGHNVYGLNMTRGTYEGTRYLLNGKRPFLLSRAAFAGSQRYTAVWTGDNAASDDHLFTAIRLVNSIGLSGIPFCGPDIGGFFGTPSPELFARWISIGCYTPFFRNHTVVNSRDQEPWAFGERVEAYAREVLDYRYRLLPYLYSMFYEASQSGMPVARSLAIDYTFEEQVYTWSYQNEYLFGDAFLIIPVASDQRSVKGWFPEGKWYRLSDDKLYEGNSETMLETPWDYLPVFVKGGSIVPLQSVIQYTAQSPDPVLELHLYNGDQGSNFLLYEDDGLTYGFETGEFTRRWIRFDPGETTLHLEASEGSYSSRFNSFRLIFHGFTPPIEERTIENDPGEIHIRF